MKKSDIQPCRYCGMMQYLLIQETIRCFPFYVSGPFKIRYFEVICDSCETNGPAATTEKEAIKKWNKGNEKDGND